MKLIVGLGNIGEEFTNTRHNIGFMVLDSFIKGFKLEKKFQALIKRDVVDNEDVLFVKPTTFMNLSGLAVSKIVNYYHIQIEDILVIHDDLDLIFGKYKLKENSSSGGHNGIKSIINYLGTQNFARLKIGISNDKQIETKDYVLGKFSKDELTQLEESFKVFQNIIYAFLKNGIADTMCHYNIK